MNPATKLCLALLATAASLGFGQLSGKESADRWTQSYDAGYRDAKGAWAGGSEIMHLAAHKGKLYAANGYWLDSRWVIPPEEQRQSAQVLRLDAPDAEWQVDLDAGKTNEFGLGYMKGNILKSVTFTRDARGKPLPAPDNLLLLAAGSNFEGGGAVSLWTRDDSTGRWNHDLVRHGSSAGGVRWVPRDAEVYRDKVTGVERLFLLLGNPGMISGVYDPTLPGKIRWDRHLEFPFLEKGRFRTRPLGIAIANGSLFFSESSSIHRRVDGERPGYVEVIDMDRDTDTDVGGIRGLTAVSNPNGPGQSLLFVWAPGERSRSEVKRLDPDGKGGYLLRNEVSLAELLERKLGVAVSYSLGGHNMAYPVTHPETGETIRILGFQGNLRGKRELRWTGAPLYAGAPYAIRSEDGRYHLREVNNDYAPGKPQLVSPRAFCLSPFGDGHLYVGGHDSSNRVSDDMAWVFRAPLAVALGTKPGEDATPTARTSPKLPRVDDGPIVELRIYQANEKRFQHLVKRFREHTDRIFRKHGMEALGYWTPTDGSPIKRRRFLYLLKHPSRYAAYHNWNRFTHDKEWEAVLDVPEFQRLLSEKPISVFLDPNPLDPPSAEPANAPEAGHLYEIRALVAKPGQLPALRDHFRKHASRILARHGIRLLRHWTPFDLPESKNVLYYLARHADRPQADANHKALAQDPDWRTVISLLQPDAQGPEDLPGPIYLKPTDFSPTK